MTDFVIRVVVDPTGAKRGTDKVREGLKKVDTSAQRTERLLKRAFAFAGFALGIRQLIRMSDEFTGLNNRLKTVIPNQNASNAAFTRLADVAKRTRAPLSAIVALFQRGAVAATELGVSQEDLFTFTERVGQALAIQGTSALQARGALNQLSQSLGSGIVRAEEFNSIMEGAFPIALAAAKGFDKAGGSVARLRQLVITGKVTSDEFFKAFIKGSEDFGEIFARTIPTISQSFTVLNDQFTIFLGNMDKSVGVAGLFSRTILLVANNLEIAVKFAVALGIALGGPILVRAVANMVALTGATTALGGALAVTAIAARLLLRVLVIGLVIEAVIALVNEFERLNGIVEHTSVTWGQAGLFAIETFSNRVIGGLMALGRIIFTLAKSITNPLVEAFAATGREIGLLFTDPKKFFQQDFSEVGKRIGEAISNSFTDVITKGFDDASKDLMTRYLKFVDDDAFDILNETPGVTGRLGFTARITTKPVRSQAGALTQNTAFDDLLKNLRREAQLLKLNNAQREIQEGLFKAEDALKRALTATEQQLVSALLLQNQALREERELLDQIQGPQEELERRLDTLDRLFRKGAISANEYNIELRAIKIEALALGRDMESGLQRGLLAIEEEFTNLADITENTVVGAFRQAEDALVQFVSTGKLSFSSLITSIMADISRLAIRQSITGPLASLLGLGAGLGGGGGIGGFFSSLFGGGGGAVGGGAGPGGLPGFQDGGSFTVGAASSVAPISGVDNRLVAFRARDGENVTITPPGQRRGGMTINYNISTPDANSFQRSQGQILSRTFSSLNRANVKDN